jgi:hypothetical protein
MLEIRFEHQILYSVTIPKGVFVVKVLDFVHTLLKVIKR